MHKKKSSLYRKICCKECKCGEDIFSTKPSCSTPPECFGHPECPEVFSTDCIAMGGDSIYDLGIPKGAKLTDVLQLIIVAITNAGCAFPTAPCLSVIGFGSTSITPITASFAWTPITGAVNYQLEYKLASNPTGAYTVMPSTIESYGVIGGLIPNTQYLVRVSTNCGTSSCYSLILLFTTNPQ